MRVLFVINQLTLGGAEQQVVATSIGLRQRGHEVYVISIYPHLELRAQLEEANVPVFVAGKYGKIDLSVVWRLRRLIKRINPDIIHAFLPASCLFTGATKWLGISAPLLMAERSINDWRPSWRIRLDNVVRSRAVGITCNAEAVRQYLLNVEGVTARKIRVIYNGLRSERRTRPPSQEVLAARQRIGAPEGAFIVTCVANFVAEKAHHVLLQAFANAAKVNDKLFLVLVGKGELEPEIRKLRKQLGIEASSRIVNDCPNPATLLCASNAALLTSSIEGCSNALLEAMAMALPAVVTRAGGNAELIHEGLGGLVCPIGDISAVSQAIVRLSADEATATEMGAYNARRIAQEFTDSVLIEASLALYRRVVRTGSMEYNASADRNFSEVPDQQSFGSNAPPVS